MNDETPSSEDNPARANYVLARALAIGINAITAGLVATAFFAVLLLWLQKRSGMALEKAQYVGVLIFILALVTLCAYLVFEYFQTQEDRAARERRAAARKKSPPARGKPDPDDWGAILKSRLKEFDPIFTDDNDAPAAPTAPAPPPAPGKPAPIGEAFEAEPTVSPVPAAGMKTAAIKDPTAELFVQAVNAAVASMDEELSRFMHFGVHLFVAGGSGELVKRGRVPAAQGKQALATMLTGLGVARRSAEALAENANTFAQVPHFRAPIDAGYRAMAQLIENGFVEIRTLPEALNVWQIQDEICQAPDVTTFVTTSVAVPPPGVAVNPEDRQRVIRTHKTVVTEVLHRFQGREIHNLGNGWIIVFDDATRAMRAAMMCQEELDKFARSNPSLVVAARVGIDTDIAAIVAHDYVSAALPRTVTIATIAPPGHIYCTEAAKNDAMDLIEFEPTALSDMYADLAPLFAVKWSQVPLGATSANPLEYRHVGALAD